MRPQAYAPEDGYRYQLLARNPQHSRTWEHCDYAKTRQERSYLLREYRLAYGAGWEFRTILLPSRYWSTGAAPA